jgi:hypothetical protein
MDSMSWRRHYAGSSWADNHRRVHVTWSDRDLRAVLDPDNENEVGTVAFSLARAVEAGHTGEAGTRVVRAQLRSHVGRYLSWDASVTRSGGEATRRLHTIDLTSGKPVDLASLFGHAGWGPLVEALLRNPQVRATLKREGQPPAMSLPVLLAALDGKTSPDGLLTFDRGMLERFAFQAIRGDKVQVHVAPLPGPKAARGRLGVLTLELPIPTSPRTLWSDLKGAERGEAGILGQAVDATLSRRFTRIELPGGLRRTGL